MKPLSMIVVVVGAALCGPWPDAGAAPLDPARFWISASNVNPTSQEAPNINAAVGRERKLYIWAQPPTDEIGNFRKLESFSLNLVIPAELLSSPQPPEPVVDFLDFPGKIKVYNPEFSNSKRFQYVFDSTPSPPYNVSLATIATNEQVVNGTPDGIGTVDPPGGSDIQGFSVATGDFIGIAPNPQGSCYAGDLCALTTNENPARPAWLVAEVAFKTVESGRSNPYFLQIGYNGITHQEGPASVATKAVFGASGGPTYDSDLLNPITNQPAERQMTKFSPVIDTFDVQITAVDFSPGDYGGNGTVGPEDYDYWKLSFGQSITPGDGADGNNNGVIDAADYVVWRDRLGSGSGTSMPSALSLSAKLIEVPEPNTGALAFMFLISIRRLGQLRLGHLRMPSPIR